MNTSGFCDVAKKDFMDGVHQPGDTYKLALFTSSASLNRTTTAYAASNEVSGSGYSAGGVTLTGRSTGVVSGAGVMTFDNAIVGPGATFSGANAALIYNSSKSNKAIAVIAFGADYNVSNGTFTIEIPGGADSPVRIN